MDERRRRIREYLKSAFDRHFRRRNELKRLKEDVKLVTAGISYRRQLSMVYNRRETELLIKTGLCCDHELESRTAYEYGYLANIPHNGCMGEIYYYENECRTQVAFMKEYKLNNNMSLHDVFFAKDTWYTKDPDVIKAMESVDEQKCPIYFCSVSGKFRNDQKKHGLLEQGAEALEVLIRTSRILRKTELPDLPYELRVKILSFLKAANIKMIIGCVALLKSQVTKTEVDYEWSDYAPDGIDEIFKTIRSRIENSNRR